MTRKIIRLGEALHPTNNPKVQNIEHKFYKSKRKTRNKPNHHHHTPKKQTRSMNRQLTEKETHIAILGSNLTADQANAS